MKAAYLALYSSILMFYDSASARVEIPCEGQINEALTALDRPVLRGDAYVVVTSDSTVYSWNAFLNQDKDLKQLILEQDLFLRALFDTKDQLINSLLPHLNEEMGTPPDNSEVMTPGKIYEYARGRASEEYSEEKWSTFKKEFLDGHRLLEKYEEQKKKKAGLDKHWKECNQKADCAQDLLQGIRKSLQEAEKELNRLRGLKKTVAKSKQERVSKFEKLKEIADTLNNLPQTGRLTIYDSDYKRYINYEKDRATCIKNFKPSRTALETKKLKEQIRALEQVCPITGDEKCNKVLSEKMTILNKDTAEESCPKNTALEKVKLSAVSLDQDMNIAFKDFFIDGKTCQFSENKVNSYPKKKEKYYRTYGEMILDQNGCYAYFKNADRKSDCESLKTKLKSGNRQSEDGPNKSSQDGAR